MMEHPSQRVALDPRVEAVVRHLQHREAWSTVDQVREALGGDRQTRLWLDQAVGLGLAERRDDPIDPRDPARYRWSRRALPATRTPTTPAPAPSGLQMTDILVAGMWVERASRRSGDGWASARLVLAANRLDRSLSSVRAILDVAATARILQARDVEVTSAEGGRPSRFYRLATLDAFLATTRLPAASDEPPPAAPVADLMEVGSADETTDEVTDGGTDGRVDQVLALLREVGAMTTPELVERTGWARTTLRRALDRGVDDGLVGKSRESGTNVYRVLRPRPPGRSRRALGSVPSSLRGRDL